MENRDFLTINKTKKYINIFIFKVKIREFLTINEINKYIDVSMSKVNIGNILTINEINKYFPCMNCVKVCQNIYVKIEKFLYFCVLCIMSKKIIAGTKLLLTHFLLIN